jgi:hypothetical protein
MGLPKGRTNNPAGRKTGSQNKLTTVMKTWLTDFLDGRKEGLVKDWEKLEPVERLQMFDRLLKYVLPTQSSSKIDLHKLDDETLDLIINHVKNLDND